MVGADQDLLFTLLFGFMAACVTQQALSYRRASGERRQQLKWLASGIAVCGVCGAVTLTFANSPGIGQVVSNIAVVGIGAWPASMAVAILRYRLYEIDRIISRTLAYAIVTGLLVGLYAGLVLLATHVLSFSSPVAVAASTLAAAALFSPLRRQVQRVVDAVDLDSVRGDLTGVVHQALAPAHVSLWVSHHG